MSTGNHWGPSARTADRLLGNPFVRTAGPVKLTLTELGIELVAEFKLQADARHQQLAHRRPSPPA